MTLTSSQQRVLALHNQMLMPPDVFSYRWELGAEELAELCGVSKSSAAHWLSGKTSRRTAGKSYQRLLAVADFLLLHAERMQPLLERW
mgnify:CR=1 FL=1